jgi:hypothetical protein
MRADAFAEMAMPLAGGSKLARNRQRYRHERRLAETVRRPPRLADRSDAEAQPEDERESRSLSGRQFRANSVDVIDHLDDSGFRLPIAGHLAPDVFHHPYAYVQSHTPGRSTTAASAPRSSSIRGRAGGHVVGPDTDTEHPARASGRKH